MINFSFGSSTEPVKKGERPRGEAKREGPEGEQRERMLGTAAAGQCRGKRGTAGETNVLRIGFVTPAERRARGGREGLIELPRTGRGLSLESMGKG
jgi:hypothetical protein